MSQQISEIPVSNLHFDPLNPRLPSSVIDGNDELAVINWMLVDASIIELMGSIGEKGFFPAEPLLVVEIADRAGHYHVVEGNRRLSAAKLLLNPTLATKRAKSVEMIESEAKHRPDVLPAFVYKNREEILNYLGFKHITGVKSWGALSKAKYLHSLKSNYIELSHLEQYKALAKAIGSRSDYVQQLLNGLAMFKAIQDHDFFDIKDLNESTIEFGVYYNLLRWANIKKFLEIETDSGNPISNINNSKLEKMVRWVSERTSENKTRLGESRNLKLLNKVIGSKEALAAFESGKTLSQSYMLTDEPNEIFSSSIDSSLQQLQTANNYIHQVDSPEDVVLNNLKSIKTISNDLRVLLVTRELEND